MPVLVPGTRLHVGLPLALVAAVLAWGLLQRTTIGLQLRAYGVAPRAARYAGFSRLGLPAALTGVMQGTWLFALLACEGLARLRVRLRGAVT